jgi:uncharacterized protein (DUF2236 family)
MKIEAAMLFAASAFALALAHPDAAQVVLASATVLASSRIERLRRQHKQTALRREPER